MDSYAKTFAEQGVVAVPGLLDAAWIESMREAAQEMLGHTQDPAAHVDDTGGSRSRESNGMWRWCEPFARLLFNSPIGSAAAEVMHSQTVRLYEDLFLYTEPGAEGAGWHRDSPHWPLTGNQLCSVWFSLEPVTRETGALRFVAGSHLAGESVTAEGLFPAVDETEQQPIVVIETEPGDCVVFHPRILHATRGAAPHRPRRSFTIRFTGDDIRWRPRRSFYHAWMAECGLRKGDPLNHPWFPALHPGVTTSSS
jgi:ectoine hydroxylase-related dioxygenase (phytanoyl-CoA dioxygenase family)